MENFFTYLGELVTLIFIISIMIYFIKSYKNNTRCVNKSSFKLDINDKDLENKYKNLDMRSFDEIAGLKEIKVELQKYIRCFDDKEAFQEQGVTTPRGILLWGPPGCGKTSLAKAIAYEAHVSFISKNASELIESQYGFSMSASDKVEQLFDEARKSAPCIVFIDELDVIGSRFNELRSEGKHQVEITKLLSEMDGFQSNKGIMVIGATNNINQLDPALLRSGRFGKKYFIGPPESREDILEVINMYKVKKRLSAELTDDVFVTIFGEVSPADVKEVFNECGITSIMDNVEITSDMLRQAVLEIKLKTNLKDKNYLSKENRLETARHEAGHAVVAKSLGLHVDNITIMGTSTGIEGITTLARRFEMEEEAQEIINGSLKDIFKQVTMMYGGIAVELVKNNKDLSKISLGASSDMNNASKLMGTIFSKLALVDKTIFDVESLYRGLSIGLPEDITESIGYNAIKSLKYCQDTAEMIVVLNMKIVDNLAHELAKKITISGEDLNTLLKDVKPYELEFKKN